MLHIREAREGDVMQFGLVVHVRSENRCVSGVKVRLQQHVCSIGVWRQFVVLCVAVYGTPQRRCSVVCVISARIEHIGIARHALESCGVA